jgi:hypothetical protein
MSDDQSLFQSPPRAHPPTGDDPTRTASSDDDFDRLAENVRLTVQALQALHAAFQKRFTGS